MLVFFLFFLTSSCQLGLKVFHWERKFCLFDFAVFSILEVYIDFNSVLLVFCFCFLFFFFFFPPRGQAWVFDFRNQYLVKFLSQSYELNFKNSALKTLWEHFQVRDIFLDPQTEALWMLKRFLNGQCSARYPCLLLHTRSSHVKRKEKKTEKSCGYLVSYTVAIFSSTIKLCTNSGPNS